VKHYLLYGLLLLAALVFLMSWYTASHKIKVGLVYHKDLEKMVDLVIEAAERYSGRELSFSIIRKPVDFDKDEIERAVEDLHREGVRLIVGPTYSTQAQFMIPLLEKFRILAISPTVTSPAVLGVTQYLVSISVSDEIQARELARAAMENGGDALLVLDERNYVYTKNFAANFISEYKGGNAYIMTVDEKWTPQKVYNICEQLKPRTLVLVCDFDQASKVVKTVMNLDHDFRRILGSDMVSYGVYSIEDHPWMKAVEVFVHYDIESEETFLASNPTLAPLFKDQSMTFINTFDALLLMEKLVKTWGDHPESIIENLPKMTYNGVGGEIRFTTGLQTQRKISFVHLGR